MSLEAHPPPATTAPRRRPGWVWAITIFVLLSAGYTLLSFLLIYGDVVPLTDVQQEYFDSLRAVDFLYSLGLALLNLVATVYLFLLRRQALPIYIAAFVLNVVITCFHLFTRNWLEVTGAAGVIGMMFGWGISIGIIAYTQSLVKRGVLQ